VTLWGTIELNVGVSNVISLPSIDIFDADWSCIDCIDMCSYLSATVHLLQWKDIK
jgi:hypothetical protein